MVIITYVVCRAWGQPGAERLHQCRYENRQKQEPSISKTWKVKVAIQFLCVEHEKPCIQPKKGKKEPDKCTSELHIYRIMPHHTRTTCWHMAHIHKYNIQPVAICSAVFDRCCSDLEINKTTIFQQELISVSAVRAWGLTLSGCSTSEVQQRAARIFLHTN